VWAAALILAHSLLALGGLHVLCCSDIGARTDSNSRRMRSKAAGDEAVRAALPGTTIFRPAPIVGEEDDFFNNLLAQVRVSVGGGSRRVTCLSVCRPLPRPKQGMRTAGCPAASRCAPSAPCG
jgi:uncharacterized protein YbjT (DUF2867 family)